MFTKETKQLFTTKVTQKEPEHMPISHM